MKTDLMRNAASLLLAAGLLPGCSERQTSQQPEDPNSQSAVPAQQLQFEAATMGAARLSGTNFSELLQLFSRAPQAAAVEAREGGALIAILSAERHALDGSAESSLKQLDTLLALNRILQKPITNLVLEGACDFGPADQRGRDWLRAAVKINWQGVDDTLSMIALGDVPDPLHNQVLETARRAGIRIWGLESESSKKAVLLATTLSAAEQTVLAIIMESRSQGGPIRMTSAKGTAPFFAQMQQLETEARAVFPDFPRFPFERLAMIDANSEGKLQDWRAQVQGWVGKWIVGRWRHEQQSARLQEIGRSAAPDGSPCVLWVQSGAMHLDRQIQKQIAPLLGVAPAGTLQDVLTNMSWIVLGTAE